jgi:hypothetical protein
LVNCISCYVDTKTGLIESNWQPSYTLTVPLLRRTSWLINLEQDAAIRTSEAYDLMAVQNAA